MRPVDRGRMVRGTGNYLLANRDEIAEMLTLESGKPYWEALVENDGAARYFEYYGNQAETVEGRSIPLGADYLDFTTYEPFGVSAQIIAWNYPLEMTARGIFTVDIDAAHRAARRIRAGQTFINEWYAGGVETPFSGYGKSGYGREKGRETLWNYVPTKNIAYRTR